MHLRAFDPATITYLLDDAFSNRSASPDPNLVIEVSDNTNSKDR